MRGPKDVVRTAKELAIEVRLHEGLPEASTVEEAARSMDVDPARIGKSILWIVDESAPVLVVVGGDRRVDVEAVAQEVDAPADGVRMARPDEVERFTGYEAGAVPPLGLARPVRTLLDRSLVQHGPIFVGAGSDRAMLEVRGADLRRLPDVSLGDFATGPS